jgi:hypothetical protein
MMQNVRLFTVVCVPKTAATRVAVRQALDLVFRPRSVWPHQGSLLRGLPYGWPGWKLCDQVRPLLIQARGAV